MKPPTGRAHGCVKAIGCLAVLLRPRSVVMFTGNGRGQAGSTRKVTGYGACTGGLGWYYVYVRPNRPCWSAVSATYLGKATVHRSHPQSPEGWFDRGDMHPADGLESLVKGNISWRVPSLLVAMNRRPLDKGMVSTSSRLDCQGRLNKRAHHTINAGWLTV